MKQAIIVFYSYTGNTEAVARVLEKELGEKYQTDMIRLEAMDESGSFLGQCCRAFLKQEATIKEDIRFNLKDYALVAVGTPVWAFGAAPAVRTYLRKCEGLKGTCFLAFASYGSGVGSKRCVEELCRIGRQKGAAKTLSLLVPQSDCGDAGKVARRIAGLFAHE